MRNTDRKVRHGHITKQGSPWARWVLQEAAQRTRTSPPFEGQDRARWRLRMRLQPGR
ncbi:MAG TPA: hypothetical protein VFA46_02575 [Actinomycetes bacterium]|nr:hypothetical protein [Actinomycetes bacterium]